MSYVVSWVVSGLMQAKAPGMCLQNSLLGFGLMVGGSQVPDSNPRRPTGDPVSGRSARVRRVRFWLRLLAAYAVAIINGVALLYITIRLLFAGVRWLFPTT